MYLSDPPSASRARHYLSLQDDQLSLCVFAGQSAGHEPALPSPEIVRAIRTIAPFVARMGPAFEAVAIQKNSDDSNFAFLTGGTGAEYYRWTVRALKAAQSDTTGLVIGQRAHPLTANDRGLLLGESDMHNAIQMDAAVSTAGIDRRPPAGVAGMVWSLILLFLLFFFCCLSVSWTHKLDSVFSLPGLL